MREVALCTQSAMPSLGEAAKLCFVECAGCSELLLVVRISAIHIIANTCLDEFLAKLGARQVWQFFKFDFVVCKGALFALSAHANEMELAHLCLGELKRPIWTHLLILLVSWRRSAPSGGSHALIVQQAA